MDPASVADRTQPTPSAPGPTTGDRCPFPHHLLGSGGAATVTPVPGTDLPEIQLSDLDLPVFDRDDPTDLPAAARCPVPHVAAAATAPTATGCPVAHGPGGVQRSTADVIVRRVLRIKERPPGVSAASAYSTFQRSMLISATRCTLTYVVFPFALPAAGFAAGVGPIIGIVIGCLALVCDTFTIRRFFSVDHKWRWHFSAIAFSIMCLLTVLLVQDISHVVGRLT